ncbi:MAG TPA: hypothetical protein VGR32_09385 [Brevundimonas sp.]|jgi:hypothetical protein|uniref:hypothetical protein n=1 Tax=Brevundimonas sp. TaxID=1871086 RepID=UPI002DEF5C3F|nr:hypothetical protein [Brevundimonas sp.]
MSEPDAPDPTEPADVAFDVRFEDATFFYFLIVDFGGRVVEVEGFVDMMWVDEDLPRAALALALGHPDPMKIRLADLERGGPRLWARSVLLDDRFLTPSGRRRWGVEISREHLDHMGDSEGPPEPLGVTPSRLQFARAALAFAERRRRGRDPGPTLSALRAAMPALKAAGG